MFRCVFNNASGRAATFCRKLGISFSVAKDSADSRDVQRILSEWLSDRDHYAMCTLAHEEALIFVGQGKEN